MWHLLELDTAFHLCDFSRGGGCMLVLMDVEVGSRECRLARLAWCWVVYLVVRGNADFISSLRPPT
jgi:hypothetical protein